MTTITIDRAVVEQALEALEWMSDVYTSEDDEAGECASCHERSYKPHSPDCKKNNAIAALRAALDAPQPEPIPVGWLDGPHGTYRPNRLWRLDPLTPQSIAWSIPLYAAPPQPELNAAVLAEREACAQEADCWIGFDKTAGQACDEIAAAIRARGEA